MEQWKDGSRKSIGTSGLALSLGASRQIEFEFEFGPSASFIAPPTPETQNDGELVGAAVGTWTLEKGDTKIILPVDSNGMIKIRGYYENFDTELWALLSASGCTALSAAVLPGFSESSPVVQRRYSLCGVKEAAARLANSF